MSEKLQLKFQNVNASDSNYQWINLDIGDKRVGKARIKKVYSRVIIHTINVFPEYERHGYARQTVDYFKKRSPDEPDQIFCWKFREKSSK